MRIPETGVSVWFNGQWVEAEEATLSITDPALQAGRGLFETLAVRQGQVLDLEEHLQRMSGCAERLGIRPPALRELSQAVHEAAQRATAPYSWLKIVALHPDRCAIFTGSMDAEDEGRPVRAVVLPWRRNPDDPLSGFKTLNYTANQLGMEEARRRGVDEGIWLNVRGHLAEGCMSNLFLVDGRRLFTPGVREGILPGIVRGHVLRAAGRLGFTVHEGKVRLPRLERAKEAFVTSSLRGIRPLVELNGRRIGDGQGGAGTRRIAEAVGRMRRQR